MHFWDFLLILIRNLGLLAKLTRDWFLKRHPVYADTEITGGTLVPPSSILERKEEVKIPENVSKKKRIRMKRLDNYKPSPKPNPMPAPKPKPKPGK